MFSVKRIVLLMVLIFALGACQTVDQKPVVETPDPKSVLPQPSPGGAVVHGFVLSEKTKQPVNAIYYLAKNSTEGAEGVPAVLVFSFTNSPRGDLNEAGAVVFPNVAPGKYAIVIWNPARDPFFIPANDGQDFLWIQVEANTVMDLGEIQVPVE